MPPNMGMNAETRAGLFAAMAAYGLWGLLPLYFQLLGDTPPLVILAHRIVWSAPTALVLIVAAGKWGEFAGVLRTPRMLLTLLGSSIAIAANWTIYIWAVTNERVLEGSLGYYINPLIVFLFAALFFGERFRPLQLLAVGMAAAGVLNQTLVVGEFPWVSLSLAFSFAIYGAIRKTTDIDSRIGFGMEALLLFAPALAYLAFFLPPGVAPETLQSIAQARQHGHEVLLVDIAGLNENDTRAKLWREVVRVVFPMYLTEPARAG